MNRCDKCKTSRSLCKDCRENPIYADIPKYTRFQAYVPACPRGYSDCIHDPAYILYKHPKLYKEVYGELPPKEAIKVEGGCIDLMLDDPKEEDSCYDNEDR